MTETEQLRCALIGALIGLARATEGNEFMLTDSTAAAVVRGLMVSQGQDSGAMKLLLELADQEKRKLVPACYECQASCGRTENYDMGKLESAPAQVRESKLLLLERICTLAATTHEKALQGYRDESMHRFLYYALYAIGMEDWGEEELLPILREAEDRAEEWKQP